MTNRRLAVPAIALAAILLLTGCGPINAGAAAADHFTEHMSGEPGVAEVQVSATNDLPFYGAVTATVVLDQGADDAALVVVVDRMAAYLRDHSGGRVSWAMSAAVDGFALGVTGGDDENHATIDLLEQARSVDGILGGRLRSALNGGYDEDYFFTIADPARFIATLGQLVPLGFPGAVQVGDDDDTFVVTSTDEGELPVAEIAAYEAVAAAYSITSATLAPGSVELRVGADDQAVAATELAMSLPGSAGITFDITGGIVTRGGEGDFTRVNEIIAQLIDVPGVTAIWAEPDVLGVTVDSIDAVLATQALVEDADRRAALTVYYRSAETVAPGFSIYGVPERRETYIPVVAALIDDGYLDEIEILADRLDITAGPYDEQRMAAFAVTLKALLPEGEDVRLTNSEGGVNFWFVSGDTITVPDDKSYGDVDAEAFVEAWNSAP